MEFADGLRLAFVRDLLEAYGSPLYLLDEGTLMQSIDTIRAALSDFPTETELLYPLKANSLRAVRELVCREGLSAEVSSAEELDLALAVGFRPESIVYNGPHKTEESVQSAVASGVRIHVDSVAEIGRVESVAKRVGVTARVGVRLDAPHGPFPWTRFGLSVESGEALMGCKQIHESAHLDLMGLHGHLGTLINEPKLFEALASRILIFAELLERALGRRVEYCDLGGGFAVGRSSPLTVHPDEWSVPAFTDFVQGIRGPIEERHGLVGRISIEPGRALVATSMCLLTTVVQTKRRGDATLVTVDATSSMVPTCGFQRHPLFSLQKTDEKAQVLCDVYGSLCTQYDIFAMGVRLTEPNTGDVLVLGETGAYSVNMSSQFIFGRPAVVMLQRNSDPLLLRERELPAHLENRDVRWRQ